MNTVAPTLFARIPGVQAFHSDEAVRSFLALRDGSVLIYAADVAGPGAICRLFDRYASFPSFFAEIAGQTGAAITIASCSGFRSGNLKVVLGEPFFAGDKPTHEVTQNIVARLEDTIRAQPFEWFPAGPFLSAMSFSATGRIPTLVGVLGHDPSHLGARYREQLQTYRGFEVESVNLGELELAAVVARLRDARQELLVLVRPDLGSDIQEVPGIVSHFFRFPTDWVALDPEVPADRSFKHGRTTFSLSLIKTNVLESLIQRGVRRLDAAAIGRARRMHWQCHRIPTSACLLADIQRLRERGALVSDLVR